jgi:hypothetical protein
MRMFGQSCVLSVNTAEGLTIADRAREGGDRMTRGLRGFDRPVPSTEYAVAGETYLRRAYATRLAPRL